MRNTLASTVRTFAGKGVAAVTGDRNIRDLVWNSMLTADLNQRYFAKLSDLHRRNDRWAKFSVAAFSSGSALASWALWKQPGVTWIWPVLSGIAAVLAIALPIFDPAKSLKAAGGLAGAWFSVFKDYELLWVRVDKLEESKLFSSLEKMGTEEKRLTELESGLSVNKRLAQKCEDEVRRVHSAQATRTGGRSHV